jgi:hypothetical protein
MCTMSFDQIHPLCYTLWVPNSSLLSFFEEYLVLFKVISFGYKVATVNSK